MIDLPASGNRGRQTHGHCVGLRRIGSLTALFTDFQRHPEPCQTGPGPLSKTRARRIPSDCTLSEAIKQSLYPRFYRAGLSSTSAAGPRMERSLKLVSCGSVKQADRPVRPRCGR